MDVNVQLIVEYSPWFKTYILESVVFFTKIATFCGSNVHLFPVQSFYVLLNGHWSGEPKWTNVTNVKLDFYGNIVQRHNIFILALGDF